jgi:hypothetical protein
MFFFGFSIISIISKSKIDLKFLLGILNSSFGLYWFINNSKKRGVGFDVTNDNLRQFPIPIALDKNDEKIINDIVNLVDRNLIKFDKNIHSLINEKIYSLCNFSDKDTSIINRTVEDYLSNLK